MIYQNIKLYRNRSECVSMWKNCRSIYGKISDTNKPFCVLAKNVKAKINQTFLPIVGENCVAILQRLLWFLNACNNIFRCAFLSPKALISGLTYCGICAIYYDECFCISHNFGHRVKVEVLHNYAWKFWGRLLLPLLGEC